MLTKPQGVVTQVVPFDKINDYAIGNYEFDDTNPVDLVLIGPFPRKRFGYAKRLFSRLVSRDITGAKPCSDIVFCGDGVMVVPCGKGHGFAEGDVVDVNISVTKR